MTIKHALAALAIAATVSAALPAAVHAQRADARVTSVDREVIRARAIKQRELARATEPDLLALLARARPGWLRVVSDTSAPSLRRVLVTVDDAPAGTLADARGLDRSRWESVRLESAISYARRGGSPAPGSVAVLRVTTLDARQPRLFVTAGVLGRPGGDYDRASDALTGAGWSNDFSNNSSRQPLFSVLGSVRYAVRRHVSVEAVLQGADRAAVEGAKGAFEPVTAAFRSTELFLPVAVGMGAARVGAGPALRDVRWEWGSRGCGCENPANGSTLAAGFMGVLAVGGGRGRLYGEGRLHATHYPEQDIPAYREAQGWT